MSQSVTGWNEATNLFEGYQHPESGESIYEQVERIFENSKKDYPQIRGMKLTDMFVEVAFDNSGRYQVNLMSPPISHGEYQRISEENKRLRMENLLLRADTAPYDWDSDSMPWGFSDS